jgi:integrase/recombinase XerD
MSQHGYIFEDCGMWYVRYRENERQPDGSVKRAQKAHPLGKVADFPRKRDIQPLADKFMEQVNATSFFPDAGITVTRFIAEMYTPKMERDLKPSTQKCYRDILAIHVLPNLADMPVREFKTYHGEALMTKIAEQGLAKSSYRRIKSVLSAVFTYAIRMGLATVNPITYVQIPKRCKQTAPTEAYSLEEITAMISFLPEPAATIVATAAYAGLRKGELRGLRGLDYDGRLLIVEQSVWNRFTTEPKSEASRDAVPVIPTLRKRLDALVRADKRMFPLFPSAVGTPVDLGNVANRIIKPMLEAHGLRWKGWHAFRRGLATRLKDMGVDDMTIMRIIRNGDVQTTRKHYIKIIPAHVEAAMEALEKRLCAGTVQEIGMSDAGNYN